MNRRLYYLGKPGDGFGWGVANTNLVRELSKLCEVIPCDPRPEFDGPVFTPVADSSLKCPEKFRAPRLLGYCFTEWPLTEAAERNARRYDVLFCGSEWNTERVRAAGVKHAQTLVQGIDFERFIPLPPSDRKGFIVFSGGKYEFRKGQDIVLAAMKVFMKHKTDAVLVASWHNPWPQSIQSMCSSWLIDPAEPHKDLPMERFINLPPVPNADMPKVYAVAHIGLFPNRCEAGTNLVMSEFMACSRPVIATYAHGHRDVLHGPGPYLLDTLQYDPAGWCDPNVSDIIWHLEHAYAHRDELIERGKQCRKLVEGFTWPACARQIYEAAFPPPAAQMTAPESPPPAPESQ